MHKLFLTSSFSDVAEYFERFAGEKVKGKTVTFIPTASIPEDYKGYVDNDKQAFEQLGLLVDELDITNSSIQEIENKLDKNNYIFISGGNTFYLLRELKKSGADRIIIDQINKGKLYIGTSAGSVVMSPNIEYVKKMDDNTKAPDLKDYQALGIVDFYPLPHYTNQPFKAAVEEIINDFNNQLKLLPISNTQVIEVKGNSYEIVGEK